MKKTLILILLIATVLISCNSQKTITNNSEWIAFDFANDLNNSIIDGFYDGDSTKVPENIYLLKLD
jgi:hypothetical protein